MQSVAENVPAGTIVATLPVTDNDMDQGVAQTVSFAITGKLAYAVDYDYAGSSF